MIGGRVRSVQRHGGPEIPPGEERTGLEVCDVLPPLPHLDSCLTRGVWDKGSQRQRPTRSVLLVHNYRAVPSFVSACPSSHDRSSSFAAPWPGLAIGAGVDHGRRTHLPPREALIDH